MSAFAAVDPALIDQPLHKPHDGYTPAHEAADTPDALRSACGAAARDFPQSLWIEPKDWADKARDNDKYNTWPVNYVDRYTNQSPSDECTTHALRTVAEACRNRQRGIIYPDGPKVNYRYGESRQGSVWLSCLSIYAEANPRQWGGAGCIQVLDIACRRGFLPDNIQSQDYGFKHTLQGTSGQGNSNQSAGGWVSLSRFPNGWEETAKWFKPLEVIVTSSWEEVVCLVLNGYAVEVGRSGHAIPYAKWNVASNAMMYVDSYNRELYDSLSTVKYASNGAFAIASMTTPDDWSRPAENS